MRNIYWEVQHFFKLLSCGSQSVIQGLLGVLDTHQGICKLKTIIIIILSHFWPFSFSLSNRCTLKFSETTRRLMVYMQSSDFTLQHSKIKIRRDRKKECPDRHEYPAIFQFTRYSKSLQSIKQCHSSH